MDPHQIKSFHAIARYKNFTVAAKKIGRSQPSISLQIKALEDTLGCKLFERLGPKKVTLTKEGDIFRELTEKLMIDFENLPLKFKELCGDYSISKLRILTHSSIMTHLLPKVIAEYRLIYPNCQIQLFNRSRSEMIQELLQGSADIGITSMSDLHHGLEYEVFSKVDRILIGPKGHPIEKISKITPKDIAQFPLVLPSEESTTRRIFNKIFTEHNLTPKIAIEVVGRTAIKTYVSMGLGLSVINEYYLTPDDKKGLIIRDVSKYFGKAETGVLKRKDLKQTQAVETFVNIIKKTL